VVVGPPNSAINEASYSTFATNHRTRDRVLYAGANDGFLHAFHAGDWDTSLDPDRYNRGTGTELFGFMPWTTVNQMKKRRPIRPCPTTFTGRTGR
jgi:type IV pilus assembly protein PilY1